MGGFVLLLVFSLGDNHVDYFVSVGAAEVTTRIASTCLVRF